MLRGALYVKLGLILALGIGFGALYLRLSAAPLSFGRLPDRVAEALAARIGPGWSVTLRSTALELQNGAPALRASGLDVRAPNGDLVLRAPHAIISVDGLSLLTANLQPKSIEFRDLQLRVLVNRDGSLAFSPVQGAEGEGEPTAPAPVPVSPSAEIAASLQRKAQGPSPVSGVVGSLFDIVVGPGGILSSLATAQLTNARLVFIDADARIRADFRRLDATFDWTEDGGRHFSATVEGSRGPWQISGDAVRNAQGGYRAVLAADGAPIQDILLLTGLSALPATTDLEFSGQVNAAFADGRVTELKAQLASNTGMIQIDDRDTSPLRVERAGIDMDWDEAARTLHLRRFELKGGETQVALQGRLMALAADNNWRLVLNGRDLVLPGAADGDGPVRISEIAADLSGPDGVAINSLTLKGPELSAEISGLLGTSADPKGLKLDVGARQTGVRSALRIWPEAVAPPVRRFLVENLKAGTLEAIDLKVAMTGEDIAKAISGGPIPDKALKIDFAIKQGTLRAAEGLPPVSGMDVTGRVTGTKVLVRAPSGRVEMADGRALAASDGSFALSNYWDDDALARIVFSLKGGADGLGALLLEPRIKEIAGFEVDPATMKGMADLRVGIGLAVNDIPAFADLPLTVNGTVSELGVDKIFGKDPLENANLTIAYDKGDLSIKGEGKLGGGPVSIAVQKTRQGGEANVAFTLDEAARNRRGLSFGSQLTGAIPLKVTMPLGKSSKPGIAVEADLAKAGVDQLIPGWVKPAGKPGKLTFTLVEGPSSEIHDLHLDSGTVQIRGTATLSGEGSLEKAELTTFKLSPGDDMKAQIERSNGAYKVTVRGNVGDARPFVKGSGTAPASNGRNAAQQEGKDVDLDLMLNILTGFNGEALTNVSLKASMRKDNIRHLDMKGRLGATDVIGRTLSQGGGGRAIVIQADDAGAVLRFVDVYRRMAGGDLIVQLTAGDGPQDGFAMLRSFTLVNEPALRRIIPTQTQVIAGQDRAGNPQAIRVDVNEVFFNKARVDFTRGSGRVDFKNAAIFGSQIGFTLAGYIDYARDAMDIAGTFVPAYGLNNAFSQVPLFGPLLGGGQYEGLFAVNFRVTGQMGSPTLNVNPLSAVAPGFLRKLFGVGASAEPQTGSLPTLPER
ncbi:DUF3971 domain-containing protein [Microvirga roseola]|uniref:DUF3971 domain-containing protein n=1 Tax=Microvirga roseola TaxID=2883126 RepID=UPI001E3A3A0E|nr:DUF3971 domain-containing protein [Microvirga roseola]